MKTANILFALFICCFTLSALNAQTVIKSTKGHNKKVKVVKKNNNKNVIVKNNNKKVIVKTNKHNSHTPHHVNTNHGGHHSHHNRNDKKVIVKKNVSRK